MNLQELNETIISYLDLMTVLLSLAERSSTGTTTLADECLNAIILTFILQQYRCVFIMVLIC